MDRHVTPDQSVLEFRRRCAQANLTEAVVDPNPFKQFAKSFQNGLKAELPQAYAMTPGDSSARGPALGTYGVAERLR